MNLRWRKAALLEARDIRQLIALDHPRVSREWRQKLERRIEILRRWPRAGRVIPEFGEENLRELIFGSYRIWYLVTKDAVEIMRIWDARREAPTEVREAPVEFLVQGFR